MPRLHTPKNINLAGDKHPYTKVNDNDDAEESSTQNETVHNKQGFEEAVRTKDSVGLVKWYIDGGFNPSFDHGRMLDVAMETGNILVFLLLVNAGVRSRTIMTTAVNTQSLEMVKFAMAATSCFYDMGRAFKNALRNGYFDIIECLYSARSYMHHQHGLHDVDLAASKGTHPLLEEIRRVIPNASFHHAAVTGDIELSKELLEVSKRLEKDGHGSADFKRAIEVASDYGNTEWLEWLKSTGIDLKIGTSALQFACSNGHYSTVKLLLDSGFDMYLNNGYAILNVCTNDHPALIDLLVQYGAKVNDEELNPLFQACVRGSYGVVYELIRHGANVSMLPGYCMNLVKARKYFDIAKILEENGFGE